jgi:EmrB/QacA subfamily drug resistance transporter
MAARSYTREERRATLGALMIVFLLGALDQTIVSTAMPRIIEHLKGLNLYAWVTTSYLLASTVTVPIYGKLGDQFGRKPVLMFGICLFLMGSALCGLSGEFGSLPIVGGGMTQLIVFRGVQGIGGGALFTIAFATLADMFSARERSKYMGLFGGVFGFASVVGPAIGGFLTDFGDMTVLGHIVSGWRLVFYVNLPLGLISLIVLMKMMPFIEGVGHPTVDYVGSALIASTFVPLLLALSWGGHDYAWSSPEIIGLSLLSVISLGLLIFVETKAREPIIPLSLFQNRVFSTVNLAGFLIGMSFFGIVMFMPLFMQVVLGVSATKSGMAMFPLMAGLMTGSIVSGNIVARIGHYKPFIVGGVVVLAIGVINLSQIGPETSIFGIDWRLLLVGLGLGPSQSLNNLAVQNAVPVSRIGIATSSSQFFRQIGSTVGVAIFGTLLTVNLTYEIPKNLPKSLGIEPHMLDLSQVQGQARTGHLMDGKLADAIQLQGKKLEVAYHGDAKAAADLLRDPDLPGPVRLALEHVVPAEGGGTIVDLQPDPPGDTAELAELKQVMVKSVAERAEHGLRNGFSVSITSMFAMSLIVVFLAFGVVLFIPEIPLRHGTPHELRSKETAG